MNENNPFDSIEIQFSADDIAVAADGVSLIADSQVRIDEALKRSRGADSDLERLAAELQLQRDCLDIIAKKTTISRVAYELGKILDSDS